MGLALLIARVLLAAVFVVAGLAKLADRPGLRQSLIDFGVPTRLATPFGVLLPLVELAVGVALLAAISAWWGAVGALALLLLFVLGIGSNLARGQHPDCHCFGQLHRAPAGWSTLLRNLVLAAIAGFIIGLGRTTVMLSPLDWFGAMTSAQRVELLLGLILLGLLALEGWGLFQLMAQQGRLLLRLEAVEARLAEAGLAVLPEGTAGLPVGSQAPAFGLSSLHGERLTLDMLLAKGKSIVLVFSDPDCGPCTALLPEVGRWQRDYVGKLTLALISRGNLEANRRHASEHGITQVMLQQDREVAEAYQVYGTPSAVLVRPDGTISSPLAQGTDAIRALVAQAIGLPALRTLPMTASRNGHSGGSAPSQLADSKVGQPAPQLRLPDLTGQMIDLADFRGSQTLVLFWNPDCGFCQQMLKDLKAWEAKPSKGAPKLLVISTGTVEANQAMGLRAPVVLDEDFSAGSQFGATGTPMAMLVDAEGKIASELASGAQAVLALAKAGQKQRQGAVT